MWFPLQKPNLAGSREPEVLPAIMAGNTGLAVIKGAQFESGYETLTRFFQGKPVL